MKLNNELIKRLANGEIAYQHTGTERQMDIMMGVVFKKETVRPQKTNEPIVCLDGHWS